MEEQCSIKSSAHVVGKVRRILMGGNMPIQNGNVMLKKDLSVPDPTYPYWLGVSEWLTMPKEQQNDILKRHVLIGGSMKVYETEEEAFAEREKHLKEYKETGRF